MISDESFLRYQRQISVPDIGESGQVALGSSHVLIIGCGGLGSAASLYLAASGVGKLVIVDDDQVELSNLHRQVIYRERDVGKGKVAAMSEQLEDLNRDCSIRKISYRLGESQLNLEVALADIVLDCSDNLPTRQSVNLACYKQSTPLVSAAAAGWRGQLMVFDFPHQSGCYRCLYPFDEIEDTISCASIGVVGPVVGAMGNMQAIAAIQKLAMGRFPSPSHQLKIFDGSTLDWQSLMMASDPTCTVCSDNPPNNASKLSGGNK
ncbi:HesA/MoeB/ThiF family protein [Vibrio ostreicida]|uniref:HesA/MoeB/ThiF family protein n=1 Tax=Vibrio ostreicida TaxID=526588 RepID=UPI0009703C71|nr:HesA/MoeB/ThiF family protein [Vibrio ostreicida]